MKWLKPRPEFGLDCLIYAELTRQRLVRKKDLEILNLAESEVCKARESMGGQPSSVQMSVDLLINYIWT